MENKEVEKNKEVKIKVKNALVMAGAVVVSSIVSYNYGKYNALLRTSIGLSNLFGRNPDLEAAFRKAIDESLK